MRREVGSKAIFVMARLVRAIHAFALAWQLRRGCATRAGITIQSNLIPV
jgi:hypothetical protein